MSKATEKCIYFTRHAQAEHKYVDPILRYDIDLTNLIYSVDCDYDSELIFPNPR